jgi:hypothetical protein
MPGWLIQLLYSDFRLLCPGGLYFLSVWGAMLFAYRRNNQLPEDSPQKREYHLRAILMAPFTLSVVLPVLVSGYLLFIIVRSLLFGIFLILFPIVLLVFRNFSIIEWLLDKSEKTGRTLLRLNMFILRLFGLAPLRASVAS